MKSLHGVIVEELVKGGLSLDVAENRANEVEMNANLKISAIIREESEDTVLWDINSYITFEDACATIINAKFHTLSREKQIELLDTSMDAVHDMAFEHVSHDLNYLIDDEMEQED